MNEHNDQTIAALLSEITPVEQKMTEAKMIIASKIADAMKEKGWKHKDLLQAVNRDNPSLVTKWLSGTHNFTVETLVELEAALGISLLMPLETEEPHVIQYVFSTNNKESVRFKTEFETTRALAEDHLVFNTAIKDKRYFTKQSFLGAS